MLEKKKNVTKSTSSENDIKASNKQYYKERDNFYKKVSNAKSNQLTKSDMDKLESYILTDRELPRDERDWATADKMDKIYKKHLKTVAANYKKNPSKYG